MLQQEDHPKIRASENPTIGSFGGEGNNPLDFTPELQKQTAAKGTRMATNSQLVGDLKMNIRD